MREYFRLEGAKGERGGLKVIMPHSEFSPDAAKEKALINTQYYLRKYGNNRSWAQLASVEWHEFTPRNVIWET